MATIDPPESVPSPTEREVNETLERSDGKMPDCVTRLPHNRVEYWSQEHLMRLDVLHVDVTEVSPSGVIGPTRSFPIDGVRYIETRGFCAREDVDDSHTWGYVGYYDASGHPRSKSGYLRSKVKPGTNGFPTLPDVVASVRSTAAERAQRHRLAEATIEQDQKRRVLMAAYGGTVSHEEVARDLDREARVAAFGPEIVSQVDEAMREAEATERHAEVLSDLSPTDQKALTRLLEDMDAQSEAEAALPQGTFAAQVLSTVTARGAAYGHPSINHQLTADLWSAWFSRKTGMGLSFSAEDVLVLNVLQKLSRLGERSKDDTWLDVLGFSENVSMLLPEQRNGPAE